jgi:hypothetical protein
MNQNPTLTFDFTLEQINAILAALPELPGKICNPIIELIQQQAKPQIEALQSKVAAEEVPLETLA